jgi:hypothetical protein
MDRNIAYVAMCIWEEIIEPVGCPHGALMDAKEQDGTHSMREWVLDLAPKVEEAWQACQQVEDYEGFEDFDWEFVPAFLRECIYDGTKLAPGYVKRMVYRAGEKVALAKVKGGR